MRGIMSNKQSKLTAKIEKILKEIGGFTLEHAEIWAGFCFSVGMDPLPFLKVMMHHTCEVKSTEREGDVPSKAYVPQLWVVFKGCRTRFVIIEPEDYEDGCFGI